MENNSSKEYVVELLKQLEALKRKKALKEKKLQKLKKNSQVQKDPTSRNSLPVSNKKSDQVESNFDFAGPPHKRKSWHCAISECSVNTEIKPENINSNVNEKKSGGKSIEASDFKISNFSEKCIYNESDKESSVQTLISNIQVNDKINSSSVKSNITELKKAKQNIFPNRCSTFDDHVANENNIEASKSTVDESTCKVIHDPQEFRTNKNNNVSISLMTVDSNTKSVPSVIFEKDSALNNLCSNQEMSDSSNKSSDKNKSCDILNESLNSNMSCFLSSDLFSAIENKEIVSEGQPSIVRTLEKSSENNIELCALIPNKSLPNVPVPIRKIKENNFEDFNFPKFSTPTDGIILSGSSSDNLPNCPNKSFIQSSDAIKISVTEDACLLNETCKDNDQPVFNSSHISSILGKGVFSVLDAHYQSPKKIVSLKNEISSSTFYEKEHNYSPEKSLENIFKRRKLFSNSEFPRQPLEHNSNVKFDTSYHCSSKGLNKFERDIKINDIDFHNRLFSNTVNQQSERNSNVESNTSYHNFSKDLDKSDKDNSINDIDFDNIGTFSHSDSFSDLQKSPLKAVCVVNNPSNEVDSQITKTINDMVTKVCEGTNCIVNSKTGNESMNDPFDNNKDSELLVIPETEGLGISLCKDDDFLETLALSDNLNDYSAKDNLLNMSSQSRLESPVVNKIVAAVKSAKSSDIPDSGKVVEYYNEKESCCKLPEESLEQINEKASRSPENSFVMDTLFLEDGSQDLGNYKQMPFISEKNIEKATTSSDSCKMESNLYFICSLLGACNEEVMDVEIVLFHKIMYAFIQHKTQIHVWRYEKKKEWVKIFNHQIEDMLSLVKICGTMDDDNLVIVMLLSNEEQYCLQFLLFEKDARVIKLMENTHWLEERHPEDSVLLCGLDGLMFATAQVKEMAHEVLLHAFISLKDSPRLMTAVLGSTNSILFSLCNINTLPNALLGINESVLYVWHILEARLVTSVNLHPSDYLPIKQCFWATVENGLIYLLTTCDSLDKHQVCQLLVANLATGFCQKVMTYSTQPSSCDIEGIFKAVYLEPFLVVSHSNGAFLWSVTEEYCCAALCSKSDVTSVAISRGLDNWGLVVIGSKQGYINCYGLLG